MADIREAAHWLAFLMVGPVRRALAKQIVYRWCLEGGRPLASLFSLNREELVAQLGLSEAQAEQVLATRPLVAAQRVLLEELAAQGIQVLLRGDMAYPEALVERLPEERLPYLFFYRGDLAVLTQPGIALWGNSQPSHAARDLALHLAESLTAEEHLLVSGYSKGVERLAFDAFRNAHGQAALILPLGIRAFGKTLDALAEDLRRGRLLALSPYLPDASYNDALDAARLPLILALVEALLLLNPERAPGVWPAVDGFLAEQRPLYAWFESDDALARAWLAAGAQPLGDLASAGDLLLGSSAPAQGSAPEARLHETAPLWQEPGVLGEEEEELPPLDPDEALSRLRRLGQVPDVLARRLQSKRHK